MKYNHEQKDDDSPAEPIVVDQRTGLIIWHHGMFHDAKLFSKFKITN